MFYDWLSDMAYDALVHFMKKKTIKKCKEAKVRYKENVHPIIRIIHTCYARERETLLVGKKVENSLLTFWR